IFVKVKLKANQAKVIKVNEGYFQAFVTQPKEKGKANKQIIKLLADYFKTSSSKVQIIKGEKSKEKIVEILV
ncbi:MAG: DUF167 domain-containing protein, partial [Microgenomates group bacterium]